MSPADFSDKIRVADIELNGQTLTVLVEHLAYELEKLDDDVPFDIAGPTYRLTFRAMSRSDFEALEPFGGF